MSTHEEDDIDDDDDPTIVPHFPSPTIRLSFRERLRNLTIGLPWLLISSYAIYYSFSLTSRQPAISFYVAGVWVGRFLLAIVWFLSLTATIRKSKDRVATKDLKVDLSFDIAALAWLWVIVGFGCPILLTAVAGLYYVDGRGNEIEVIGALSALLVALLAIIPAVLSRRFLIARRAALP